MERVLAYSLGGEVYRGKRERDGEWVYGDLIHTAVGKEPSIRIHWHNGAECHGVIPDTVGQYTKMNDKNGKMIYKGDIVIYDNTPYNAYGHRITGEIVWHKWAWRLKYKEYGMVHYYALGSEDFFGAKSEVVGNIYDDPDLLRYVKE